MSTLSTATTHDHESPSTPTYPNGEPILYTGNPAELTGILEALNEHFVNNGMFQPLLTHGAVLLRNGKVAVDSFTTATFLTDSTYKAGVGSFAEPYESAAKSIAKYNATPAGKKTALTEVTTKPTDFDTQFIVSPEMCKAEDNKLLKTVLSIIPNETIAGRLRTAAKGSGRALLNLLRTESAKAKPADTALVEARFNAHVLNKIHGAPITAENLAAFIEKYKQLEAMLPAALKNNQTDGTRLEIVNQLAQLDPNICDQYEIRMVALGTSAPSTMDAAVALIEEILRTREARAKLAALSGGAKQLGLLAGDATVSDRDPTKNKPGDEKKSKKTRPPRRPDGNKEGELLKWVEGMDVCKCGGKHLYRDCTDPKTKAWLDASKAKRDAERGKTALAADVTPAAAPASALVSAGARTTTVTISGDHTTDERALLAQLSGFFDSAAPSKIVHSANVAQTKVIDGVVQLVEPSPDEHSLAAALGIDIATADFDPSNTRCPDFVPGCSGTCARQYETDTTDSASSDDEPDPAPRCEECADNPDERLFSRVLKFLPHFWACIVTGMLLGLDPMDRELLDDDAQLMFVVHDCVEERSLDPPRSLPKHRQQHARTFTCLANPRPCDEIYSQANGNISRCEAIGDLPVIVRNKQGTTVQLTFTNVRCVPDFKFSLLSVKQLWNEQ
ncbi:hypothetical protein Ctob_016633, partial [Chrysochromulina tobinii]